ncbi:MBL fold metallo-hydrolase [Methanocella sp. CWC-04]|uniref:MBL fold metallo-hydrolase n=1 Tax=Methanooceanicella nereidis TaxID=2052831 RepID=A0AAP2RD41_9EURY|nr:alkyl sulfatase dimerization domain-containing protein [Methanocella sp. CWC-04]MCD1295074.1 MBL fold metallo-hydrolase [Methanocella sp. CWC-04]
MRKNSLRSTMPYLSSGLLTLFGLGVYEGGSWSETVSREEEETTVNPQLAEHSKIMQKKIYRVRDNVYLAYGYGLANAAMIVGDDGVIIIDTMENEKSGREVLEEFRKITDKPIKAIIYTHHHPDHIFGVKAFISENDAREGKTEIYAHESLLENLTKDIDLAPVMSVRAFYSMGTFLEKGPGGAVEAGIGPEWREGSLTFIRPTKTFRDTLDVEVAGIRMHLFHVPGEASDEIAVWFPDMAVLHTAEIIQGETFPNIYSIRGSRFRDPVKWFKSIDKLREFPAKHMVPSHGRPVSGNKNIRGILTAYRDAIQFVHDQTVRFMNKGLTPDELVEVVKLPKYLAGHPWLGEFYGTVDHSVRQIYNGYLGFFDGDMTYLAKPEHVERAVRYVEIMGGRDNIIETAQKAIMEKRYGWAMDILTWVIRMNYNDMEARKLKAEALRHWGYLQTSINWRNWALTAALELEGELDISQKHGFGSTDIIKSLPARGMLEGLTMKLKAEETMNVHKILGISLADTGDRYGLEIRRGVCQFHSELPAKTSATIIATKDTLIRILLGEATLEESAKNGSIEIEGKLEDVKDFFSHFEHPSKEPIKLTMR